MRGKIAKNTLILFLSRFGSHFLVFLFEIYVARALGVVDFGKFTFAMAFVMTFVPLADFGMENFLLKRVSHAPAERVMILKNLFLPRIFFSVLAYFLALVLAFSIGYSASDLTNIALCGLMLFPYSIYYLFLAYFNAQEKVVKSSLIKVWAPSAYIFFSFLFLKLGWGYRGVFLGTVLANSLTTGILLFFYPQLWQKVKFSLQKVKQVCQQTYPFAILIFIAVFYLRADVIILKRLMGSQATGWYGPATALVESAILIPQSFTLALFPLSARLLAKDKKKMTRVYRRGLSVLFLTSLPVVILGFFLTPVLLPLLFGAAYLPSIPALKIVFLSLILFFMNSLPGNVILNSKKIKGFIPWALTNLGVNLLLNFLLIPSFSFVGAAWAKLGSEFYGFLINNFYVYRLLNEKKNH